MVTKNFKSTWNAEFRNLNKYDVVSLIEASYRDPQKEFVFTISPNNKFVAADSLSSKLLSAEELAVNISNNLTNANIEYDIVKEGSTVIAFGNPIKLIRALTPELITDQKSVNRFIDDIIKFAPSYGKDSDIEAVRNIAKDPELTIGY